MISLPCLALFNLTDAMTGDEMVCLTETASNINVEIFALLGRSGRE